MNELVNINIINKLNSLNYNKNPMLANVIQFIYDEHQIWLYTYQPNKTGYWANNITKKAKFGSYIDAYEDAIEITLNNILLEKFAYYNPRL